jgi:hypothetical protein
MSTIIAARFTTFHEAEDAARRLFARGFLEEDVTLFYVSPSGQHARLATGGDKHADAGARDAAKGAGKGVTIGAVIGAVVGAAIFAWFKSPLLVCAVAAGVFAYVGSLAGAMSHSRSGKRTQSGTQGGTQGDNHGSANAVDARRAGVLLAVHASPDTQADAATILRDCGGMEVERASGQWRQGQWADFDPTVPPTPISELAGQRA